MKKIILSILFCIGISTLAIQENPIENSIKEVATLDGTEAGGFGQSIVEQGNIEQYINQQEEDQCCTLAIVGTIMALLCVSGCAH